MGYRKKSKKIMDIGEQRSFHKQPSVVLIKNKSNKKVAKRHVHSVGLGIKTPKDAKVGTFIDKKCPFTGNVAIRGRLLTVLVTKKKMQRTCTIRRDYLHYIKKYNRFEKRHKMLSAHVSPAFRDISVGDLVTVGECRPLQWTAFSNSYQITNGDITECWTDVGRKHFVAFFETIVLLDVMKIITSDGTSTLHLLFGYETGEKTATDSYVSGKWTFLVDECANFSIFGCFNSQTNGVNMTLGDFLVGFVFNQNH